MGNQDQTAVFPARPGLTTTTWRAIAGDADHQAVSRRLHRQGARAKPGREPGGAGPRGDQPSAGCSWRLQGAGQRKNQGQLQVNGGRLAGKAWSTVSMRQRDPWVAGSIENRGASSLHH